MEALVEGAAPLCDTVTVFQCFTADLQVSGFEACTQVQRDSWRSWTAWDLGWVRGEWVSG